MGATFTNNTDAEVRVSDEFGTTIVFAAGETKTDQSEYLQKWVDLGMLTRNSVEVDARLRPAPAIRNENMVFNPGSTTQNAAYLSNHTFGATPAARKRRVVFDPSTDTIGRSIKTEFVGARLLEGTPTTDNDDGFYIDITAGSVALYLVVTDANGDKSVNEITFAS